MSGLNSNTDKDDNSLLNINIQGRLDYNLRKQFREAYSESSSEVKNFNVNLAEASYIDSSGLGMLLVLKDHADAIGGKVSLKNPNTEIREILELSNFNQLFDVN